MRLSNKSAFCFSKFDFAAYSLVCLCRDSRYGTRPGSLDTLKQPNNISYPSSNYSY